MTAGSTPLSPPTGNAATASLKSNTWVGGNMPVARFGLIINLLVPLLLLIWDAMHHSLGADPVNFAIHTTGFVALLYLLLSLVVTPLRSVTGYSWLVQFRRSLGVYAFYYAAVHLSIYFWWDRQRNLSGTVHEITHRYYLLIGFLSLALMAPLWATSFNAAIRAMGGKNWKRLHRLAYVAAVLGGMHFYLQSKADKHEPNLFFAILAPLFAWRLYQAVRHVTQPHKPVVSVSTSSAPATTRQRFFKGQLRVIDMIRETPNVRTFRLAPLEGNSLPFTFSAGQFLNLSMELQGKRVSRSYTIASPPTREAYVDLTIKRESQGQVSAYLHDMLMTGHSVTVSGPAGRFSFDPASASAVLLIAGGVGITPLMSIARYLTDIDWPGQVDLLVSARTPDEIIFADELTSLANQYPNLHVHITVTRASDMKWTGLRGRITAEVVKALVPDFTDRPAFICGPDEMAHNIRAELISAGLPAALITVESFTPTAADPAESQPAPAMTKPSPTISTPTVTFARSGRTAPLGSDKTILDAAEEIGVQIDSECRSGVCGTCRCKLITGRVNMDIKIALSDADEADGYILACQAIATADCTVDA